MSRAVFKVKVQPEYGHRPYTAEKKSTAETETGTETETPHKQIHAGKGRVARPEESIQMSVQVDVAGAPNVGVGRPAGAGAVAHTAPSAHHPTAACTCVLPTASVRPRHAPCCGRSSTTNKP
jgi:hypothetical protein